MDLRPEDFQHSWANALAHGMSVAVDVLENAKSAQQAADSSREELVALAESIPQWANEAGKRLQQIADTQITRIEATHSALVDTQAAFNHQMKEAMSSIQKKIDEFDAKLLEAYRAKTRADSAISELEKKRAAFNKLSLWDRIFKKI